MIRIKNHELRIKGFLWIFFVFLFLFIIHNSTFIIHPVSAQCGCTYPQNCTLTTGGAGEQACSGVLSGTTCVYDSSGVCSPNCTACATIPACGCTYPQNCTLTSGGAGVQVCNGVLSGTTCVYDSSGVCSPNCTACAATGTAPVAGGGPFDPGPNPAGLKQITNTFRNVIAVVVALAFVALFIMLVLAGFKYLRSGGEPKALHAAHQTVTWALLGIIFMAVAWLILQLISVFTGLPLTIFNLGI